MTDKIKHIIVGFTLAVLIAPLTYFFDFNTVVGVFQVKSFNIYFESDQLGGSNLEYIK